MKILSVVNQKGGVGKTTTSINLSACLYKMKRRVLLVDLDPQSNATRGSGIEASMIQNSINDVKTELTSRVQDFIVQAKGQNTAHQACLKKCNDQTNVDSKSACQYGCNVGYFANQGPNVRRMGNTEGNKLAPPAAAVLAEVFSGAALTAVGGAIGLGATIGLASEGFQGREGFEPGAPSTTGGGNPNVGNDTSAVMGTYGTTGYGKQLIGDDSNIQRALGGRKINTLLGILSNLSQTEYFEKFKAERLNLLGLAESSVLQYFSYCKGSDLISKYFFFMYHLTIGFIKR
mgnify:CR=1 FL=1